MTNPFLVEFAAGHVGDWRIDRVDPVVGESLAFAARLTVSEASPGSSVEAAWVLRGTLSNTRYTTRAEAAMLRVRFEIHG